MAIDVRWNASVSVDRCWSHNAAVMSHEASCNVASRGRLEIQRDSISEQPSPRLFSLRHSRSNTYIQQINHSYYQRCSPKICSAVTVKPYENCCVSLFLPDIFTVLVIYIIMYYQGGLLFLQAHPRIQPSLTLRKPWILILHYFFCTIFFNFQQLCETQW